MIIKETIPNGMLAIKIRFTLLSFFWVSIVLAQTPKPYRQIQVSETAFKQVGTLPPILKEASGLYIDQQSNLWSHNDDRYSILYCFDSTGLILKTVHLNHPNKGWEALAADRVGNIFIAATGNNKNDRQDLHVVKVKPPNTITEKITQVELIWFNYENQVAFPPAVQHQNFDADALLFYNDSLFIFSKNRTRPFTGYSTIYYLPQTLGKHKALKIDSLYIGKGPMMEAWITDVALSPDKKILALLGHDKIWLISDFKNKRFSEGTVLQLNLPHFTHKAGIAFKNNSSIYVVDEKEFEILGGNIYQLDLTPYLPTSD